MDIDQFVFYSISREKFASLIGAKYEWDDLGKNTFKSPHTLLIYCLQQITNNCVYNGTPENNRYFKDILVVPFMPPNSVNFEEAYTSDILFIEYLKTHTLNYSHV